MELYREQVWTVVVKHLTLRREPDTTIAAFTNEREADECARKYAEGRTDIEVYVRKGRTWFPKGLVWMLDAIPTAVDSSPAVLAKSGSLKLVVVNNDVANAETGEIYLERVFARPR